MELRCIGGQWLIEFDAERRVYRFGLSGLTVVWEGHTTRKTVSVLMEVGTPDVDQSREVGDFGAIHPFLTAALELDHSDTRESVGRDASEADIGDWLAGEPLEAENRTLYSGTSTSLKEIMDSLDLNRLEFGTDRILLQLDSMACSKMKWVLTTIEKRWRE